MTYIHRQLEHELNRYINTPEVIAVLGPRQCGKTTLLQYIQKDLPDCIYLTFEDRDILRLFEDDVKVFNQVILKDHKHIIIDEFQYARQGGKNLKYLYDTTNKKFYISGSSALELSLQASRYLVGRLFVFNLYPLNLTEYLSFAEKDIYQNFLIDFLKKLETSINRNKTDLPTLPGALLNSLNSAIDHFVVYGGYPRQITASNVEEKQTVLKNIYSTYLLKEIKDILGLATDYELENLVKALGLQLGNLVVNNELSKMIRLSLPSLNQHLGILEKTFIIKLLQPYYTNKRLELVKIKKVYFIDAGFRNIVLGNLQDIALRPDKGSLYENFAFSEFLKKGADPKYWRTKSKAEVDFIVEEYGNITPVEVKSQLDGPSVSRSFLNFIKKYRPQKGFIFSKNYYNTRVVNSTLIYFLPFVGIPALFQKNEVP